MSRIGLKQVHLNRAPILVELRHVSDAQHAMFGIDLPRDLAHAQRLREATGLTEKIRRVFGQTRGDGDNSIDADLALYAGFPDPHDKRLFAKVRQQRGVAPQGDGFGFHEPRYEELAFRYRARNFPDTLSSNEHARWQAYRAHRLAPNSELSEYDFATYYAEIAEYRTKPETGPEAHRILDALQDWGRRLEQSL